MAHTETYTAKNAEAAKAIAEKTGVTPTSIKGRNPSGMFSGRRVEQISATEFEIYASNADHTKFERLVAACNSAVADAAEVVEDQPATPRQISYLNALIERDPGAAMTIGASSDGSACIDRLTRARASKFIDMLTAGV
ncbi:hypothetical protein KZZ07_21180 [Mameliella sp. CS4]|uniref:hypothetical protein n=1 Tax=Mameliella sp. CS4 TaxID=2862329 RepID=UPI001C5FDB11|nr:hypothetical protein [Mameliella sp. CS4]MBW4985061.1 hypothetical protein [Mameliella sp. CS4]